ncbi:MAG: hypothetical protein EOM37_15035 [Proteobacteria bacterium]|nr:hypothetical protein [Pseudomonadota bacterium]
MTKLFPEISAPRRTKDPRERLMARLAGQVPFPQAPRGKDGGLVYAIVGILLTSVFNIYMFCAILLFNLCDPQYSNVWVFYYSMSLILGIFGIFCVAFLTQENNFAVNMAIIYSGTLFIHNYYYCNIRSAILFPRYITPISAILLFYFIFSKRVRNTYRWVDGDREEDTAFRNNEA